MRFISGISFLLVFNSSSFVYAESACAKFNSAVRSGSPSSQLKRFVDTQWTYYMTEFPEWATDVGFPGQNDRWTDRSLAAIKRRENETRCQYEALKKIPRARLGGADAVNYDLLSERYKLSLDEMKFPDDYLVLSHLGGVHSHLADTFADARVRNVADLRDLLKRLERAPELIAQNEVLLREGMKLKVMPVKMFLEKVPAQFDKILPDKIDDNPIYKAFLNLPQTLPETERVQAQATAKELLSSKVIPALEKFRTFVTKEYIPAAREDISWKSMPNGEAWYALMVRAHTTTNRTPKEIHDLGLKEVERIAAEMTKIREQVKFKGDAKAFNKFLLTDKRFYYNDKEALLVGYRDIAKRIDAELPKLFKTLPRQTYGVREMPDYKAKDSPTAFYIGGSLESGRAGFFEANTYDLKARPKWGMEALTIHEAVPGHHLQIALAQEATGVPEFRKHTGYTAFIEGWALYSESLGEAMGFYKDPYSKYGQLSYEMWRAVRLVVDTGMHQFGWTRDQAISYMLANLPKSQLEAEVEIDRYITWPGQALAYKMGELKIHELREKARTQLGEKFDIREFHDEVLKNGALPLEVLAKNIDQWTRKKRQRSAT